MLRFFNVFNAVMPYDVSQQVIIIKGQFNCEGYFHRNLSSPTIKIDQDLSETQRENLINITENYRKSQTHSGI